MLVRTETIEELKEYFLYEDMYYLRVYRITNGDIEYYWSNISENERRPNYTFEKWKNSLDKVKNLYNREEKLKRIL